MGRDETPGPFQSNTEWVNRPPYSLERHEAFLVKTGNGTVIGTADGMNGLTELILQEIDRLRPHYTSAGRVLTYSIEAVRRWR